MLSRPAPLRREVSRAKERPVKSGDGNLTRQSWEWRIPSPSRSWLGISDQWWLRHREELRFGSPRGPSNGRGEGCGGRHVHTLRWFASQILHSFASHFVG